METPIREDEPQPIRLRSPEIVAKARRRRMMRVLTAVLLGCIVGAYTLGALDERVLAEDRNDLLPPAIEAAIMGLLFTLSALPVAWAILARVFIPIPTFILYMTVLQGKNPPLPFYAAFAIAAAYSGMLTVLSSLLADRPGRPILGSRSKGPRV